MADIENFYTNIDVVFVTQKIEIIIKGHPNLGLCTVEEVQFLMYFVNHSIYFKYDDVTHYQKKELAIGTPSSSIIANLFLAIEEKQWRLSSIFWKHIRMYNRCINNIFYMFQVQQSELKTFIEEFSFNYLKLTFYVRSTHSIPCLDCSIRMGLVE